MYEDVSRVGNVRKENWKSEDLPGVSKLYIKALRCGWCASEVHYMLLSPLR